MSFRTVSALLRGTWLINREYVHANRNLVADLRMGKPVDFGISERELAEKESALAMTAYKKVGATLAYAVSPYTDLERIPAGSVAIVSLVGPLLKYGDGCSYGMADKAVLLDRIAASGKFKAVVMEVDTPGGQTDGTQLLAETITYLSIPVVAVVNDGMMASAGIWIGSACAEIYATKATDSFGSIGVYFTMYDFTKYLEEQGINIIEIYAEQSTDKNLPYKRAMEGDETLIREECTFIAGIFIEAVKTNRGARLNTEVEDPFTGKMFPAAKALEIGLIDGIISMNEVIDRASALGDQNQSVTPNSQNTMFGSKFKGVSALKGLAAVAITSALMSTANADIESEGIEHVTLVLDSELETAATAVASNTSALAAINAALGKDNSKATLGEAVTALVAAHATATASVSTLTTDRDDWKSKAVEFGAKGAAEHSESAKEGDDKIEVTEPVNVASTYSEADSDLAKLRAKAGIKPKATK